MCNLIRSNSKGLIKKHQINVHVLKKINIDLLGKEKLAEKVKNIRYIIPGMVF